MVVFKCKMCGATLDVAGDTSVVTCEYCGTKQTVSLCDDEKRVNLYNRANRLRLANEFDKAASLYESIVAEFPEEAEAYWGLVLCHYGIEYVDDPATAKKIPTCHRASFDSVLGDDNYQMALENADVIAQKVYRDQARELERIRTEIFAISQNESPYDIFICYKETDHNGERTIDSVIAQNVYDALTEKGYKVFFSRISLEDKLGQQYEPFIFAALNSAKIMLAFGTQYEYYHAVWVKNEWNRFLKLMAKDKSKVLIPCYKDMDAYDMPEEFKPLQAQDMGKIGAIQDLVRGIGKILPLQVQPAVSHEINSEIESLLKRLFMFLDDGDFISAENYCERILDIEPECGKAYLGKLMIEYNVRKIHEFSNCTTPITTNINYQKVLKYADDDTAAIVKRYVEEAQEKAHLQMLESLYQDACKAKETAKTKQDWEFAVNAFTEIAHYKDSQELKEVCCNKLNELSKEADYRKALSFIKQATCSADIRHALELLTTIPDYKDVQTWIQNISSEYLPIFELLESFECLFQKWDSSKKMPIKEDDDFFAYHKQLMATIQSIDSYQGKHNFANAHKLFMLFEEKKVKVLLWDKMLSQSNDVITFGKYMGEDIKWEVLKWEDTKCLLISTRCLEMCAYANSSVFLEWSKSTARKFLNADFADNAFTDIELDLIADTRIDTYSHDKVFILTQQEIETYFPDKKQRQCSLSNHLQQTVPFDAKHNHWWLRTEGTGYHSMAYVDSEGDIHPEGEVVSTKYNTIRPAIWLDLTEEH